MKKKLSTTMVLVITPFAGSARGKFEAEGGCAGPGGKVDAPELSSGPVCEIQEVSRVGAQGVTSKSKLLAREMPDLHTGGLRVDSGAARSRKGARAEQRVDRRGSYASVGPEWEIQEVSRVGAQGVTSKSRLLAREMPDLQCKQINAYSPPAPVLGFMGRCGRAAHRSAPSRQARPGSGPASAPSFLEIPVFI